MDATNATVLTGVIVVLGEWADGSGIKMRTVVGGTVLAIGLSVLEEANAELASKFATLVVISAAFMYAPGIMYKAGMIKTKPPKWV
jgi:hypothetical protein